MRKRFVAINFVCALLLVVAVFPQLSHGVGFKVKPCLKGWGEAVDIWKTHEPGTPPASTSFPLVVYLIGIPRDSDFGLHIPTRLEPGIVPEYIGYLVVDADYTMTFVNKTKYLLKLSDMVAYYNAKPQDGRAVLGESPAENIGNTGERPTSKGELWLPRWSWNFVRRFLIYLTWTSYASATMDVPPDDAFVPHIVKRKNTTDGQVRYTYIFNTELMINNSPYNDTVPLNDLYNMVCY